MTSDSLLKALPSHPLESEWIGPEAALHSRKIDEELGIDAPAIEKKLVRDRPGGGTRSPQAARQNFWIGLASDTLQTPYIELLGMVRAVGSVAPETLAPGKLWVELGAGYSRLAHVLRVFAPGLGYLGIESVPERAHQAQKAITEVGASHAQVLQGDLTALPPEHRSLLLSGDVYFNYDFGTQPAIETSLEMLRTAASQRKIVVVARGRAARDTIERGAPWLSQAVRPLHTRNFSIYRSS